MGAEANRDRPRKVPPEPEHTAESRDATSSEARATDDGATWLARMLSRLDGDKAAPEAATHTESEADEDSSDSGESEQEDGTTPRGKELSPMELLFADLSEVSSLARKSNFCAMDVNEEGWQEYRNFMCGSYRSLHSKTKRRTEHACVVDRGPSAP